MKTYLITGAAQGIGQAIAELLLTDPQNSLVIIDKQKTDFIEQHEGERFRFHLQDIADRAGLVNVLQQIAVPLDGIINNAGEVYFEQWGDMSLETWDRTLAVNLTAPLQITHALRDRLQKGASVVNIASTDGMVAAFDTMAYAASKAGLMNLTKSMAVVLGEKGVRVNAVAPGWVETPMTEGTLPAETVELTPLKRNAQAGDVAQLVAFLLSDTSSFITGQTITLDGGLTSVDYTLWRESQKA